MPLTTAASGDGPGEDPRTVVGALRTRRTVQLFEEGRVPPRGVVLRALELARWAPNHKLTQPWRVYLLGPETARAVAHLNAELVAAKLGPAAGANKLKRWLAVPGWAVVTCAAAADPVRAREDDAACACFIQSFMLALWSEGVGTKWTTGDVTRDARFSGLVGFDPAAEAVVGMVWYGYPAEVPKPPPRRPVEAFLVERP